MVSPIVALLSALVTASPAAVVRTAVAPARSGAQSTPLVASEVLPAGAILETGPVGYLELHVLGLGRVRASAGTRLVLPAEGAPLELLAGRLWVTADRAGVVRSAGTALQLLPGTLVVLELSSNGTLTLVARTSGAQLRDGDGVSHAVPVDRTLVVKGGRVIARPIGGAGLVDLAVVEARAHEGDRIGLERFLLQQGTNFQLGQAVRAGVRHGLRGHAEVAGGSDGPTGSLIEEGLRPPPFYEEEVPPKGPNVLVEVDFREE